MPSLYQPFSHVRKREMLQPDLSGHPTVASLCCFPELGHLSHGVHEVTTLPCGCALSAVFSRTSDHALSSEQTDRAGLLSLRFPACTAKVGMARFDSLHEQLSNMQVSGRCRRLQGVDSKSCRLGTTHPILLSTVQPGAACDSPTGTTHTKCMLNCHDTGLCTHSATQERWGHFHRHCVTDTNHPTLLLSTGTKRGLATPDRLTCPLE